MNFPFEAVVNSEQETAELARNFSELLRKGDVVFLNGDLGSGKTFFVKAVCSNLGIEHATSPSFAIVNEYGDGAVFHFDFYRIKKAEELLDIGFEDYINDSDAILFIEWAELIPEVLPHSAYEINIEYTRETSRKFTITKKS